MKRKIDRARKQIAIWAETANRIKALSEEMDISQVELIHQAILMMEQQQGLDSQEWHSGQTPTG